MNELLGGRGNHAALCLVHASDARLDQFEQAHGGLLTALSSANESVHFRNINGEGEDEVAELLAIHDALPKLALTVSSAHSDRVHH